MAMKYLLHLFKNITKNLFFCLAVFASSVLAGNSNSLALSSEQACHAISSKLASVGKRECSELNLALTGALSVKKFPILIKEYPPLGDKKPLGRILLIGGTHGDELSSISVVFKWMHKLEQFHSGKFHWRVVPLLNPDGALLKKHTRQNANGVDLNRNFSTPGAKEQIALDHWKMKTDSNKRRYPGPAPLSEPETQWLFNEISTFKPDVIIAVHAPFSLVDYDAPDRDKAPRRIGYLHKNLMGTYPGSLGNFAGIHLEIPVITLELPHSGIMPSNNQISQMWIGLVRWLSRHLKTS
jgi:protein MpaA